MIQQLRSVGVSSGKILDQAYCIAPVVMSHSHFVCYVHYERTLIGQRALQEGKRSAAKADRI